MAIPTRFDAPTCTSCGGRPQHGLFCRTCWRAVPAGLRREVDQAWKVYIARPGSLKARHDYEQAVADAAGAIA